MKTKTNIGPKPYNRCLSCNYREGKRCDGPRTSAMKLDRWCEFMRDMKEANDLTNAYIAEKSGVSIKTVERLMAQNCDQDIMRETARLIEDAIIGSSNQYPCYLAFEESVPDTSQKLNEAMIELERALNDNKDYRDALDNIHNSYNAEMQIIRDEAQKEAEATRAEHQKQITHLLAQIEDLRGEVKHLREENARKSKVVDTFLANNNIFGSNNKNTD